MFTDFLYALRSQGLVVGSGEWMGFLDALRRGLATDSHDMYVPGGVRVLGPTTWPSHIERVASQSEPPWWRSPGGANAGSFVTCVTPASSTQM